MRKKIIIFTTVLIIIITGLILLTSNQEESVEEKWLKEKIVSGPFTLDKAQYNVGEKIFITVENMSQDDKGQMIFFRPIENEDGWINYITIDFNGESKEQFNLYFEPQLSKIKNICSANDLVGTWKVKFIGTQYSDLTFELLNQTSSWDKRTFEPVC